MDEGRKRVVGIIAGILMSRNLDRADDLFGGPQSPLKEYGRKESVSLAEDWFYSDTRPVLMGTSLSRKPHAGHRLHELKVLLKLTRIKIIFL